MSFNSFKSLIQKIQSSSLSKKSKNNLQNDKELECLQFGICAVEVQSPRPEELFFS